jgi:hypothetical protein
MARQLPAAGSGRAGVAGSDRSASTATAVPPLSWMRATTAAALLARLSLNACGMPGSSGSATRRYVQSTAQPLRASASAVAAPMPWLAPVTIAVWSLVTLTPSVSVPSWLLTLLVPGVIPPAPPGWHT